MLFVPLVIAVVIAAGTTYLVILRWPSLDPASPRLTRHAAQHLRGDEAHRGRLGQFIAQRRDGTLATGFLLTVAASVVIIGGLILGSLVLLVRSNSALVSVDLDISRWVNSHDTTFTHRVMNALTNLGAGTYVVAFAVLLAIVEYIRLRSRWIVPFLAVLLIGESLITLAVKNALDRARPALNPTAHLLGPSFPSGHTATVAAFFAGAALLMGRARGRRAHALLAALALGAAVTVACTRVLLDVHWLSDVLGGLALGWAWFALCSIAFGGRLLRFGAPVAAVANAP